MGEQDIIMDMNHAAQIPIKERCKRCDGTGNELFNMYRRCQACGGDGKTRGNEGEFSD